jgi:hypothetical protein
MRVGYQLYTYLYVYPEQNVPCYIRPLGTVVIKVNFFHEQITLPQRCFLRRNDWGLAKVDLQGSIPKKMLSAGFEPTPRETDFDSVVGATSLRPVIDGPEETIHESISKRVLIEKDWSFGRFRTWAVQEKQISTLFR